MEIEEPTTRRQQPFIAAMREAINGMSLPEAFTAGTVDLAIGYLLIDDVIRDSLTHTGIVNRIVEYGVATPAGLGFGAFGLAGLAHGVNTIRHRLQHNQQVG